MDTKELILGGLAYAKRSLYRAMNGLTPEEMKWQPRPDANSVQIILFHMARYEDNNVQVRLQGKPEVWETGKWYQRLNRDAKDAGNRYTAEQVAAFAVSDIRDLLDYAAAVRSQTIETINGMKAIDFDRKITMPAFGPPLPPGAPPRPPVELAAGTLLLNQVIHLAQHAGEISFLRGLQRGLDK